MILTFYLLPPITTRVNQDGSGTGDIRRKGMIGMWEMVSWTRKDPELRPS